MAVFKCKMCGGALEVEENQTVATCDYCGTQQTLPKLNDEKIANLYDRANHFRRNNEFDKAMGIYDQILNEDKSDAEAYWSIVLCRYGIEYVEDPLTRKRVPTVHRAQFTSVFDDADYKSAIQYADAYQKTIYETEAKAINEIQKGILSISQQEEPFDVFICYKETDNTGRRTPDSVLANDLYHQLTQEGFKVFFARITLEDKIGTEYEPYIFAALNSAKVMVVLGTKPEYFNAVWVKNEWSRYLSLVKNSNGKKILIPAYKDMDAYDLPEEFSHLQAQDMSKLGFMQDLIRGIKKLVQTDEPKPTVVRETVVTGGNANVDALLKRVFIFLEDKAWKDADEYCEKVLDIDPENAEAYLGKLLSELRVSKRASLRDYEKTFDDKNNYQKVLRYGDDELREEIKNCNEYIRTRNEKARLDGIYDSAKSIMLSAKSEDDYRKAAEKFKSIIPYMDSAELAEECLEKGKTATLENLYNKAKKIMMFAHTEAKFREAADGFAVLLDYKDSEALRAECIEKAAIEKEREIIFQKDYKLESATQLMSVDTLTSFQEAIDLLEKIPGWKDADEKLAICREKYAELKVKVDAELAEKKRKDEAARLERERLIESEQKAIKRKKATKKIVKIVAVVGIIVAIISIITYIPYSKYKDALALMEQGKYEEAIAEFGKISGYKDVDEKVQECNKKLAEIEAKRIEDLYNNAISLKDQGKLRDALNIFYQLNDYKDSKTYFSDILKVIAVKESIALGGNHTVMLKQDGKVVAVGDNSCNQCDVSVWSDIVSVSAGQYHTVGLKSDGTVVATKSENQMGAAQRGQGDVENWSDIVSISAGFTHTVGLRSDGTVVATGDNFLGQSEVGDWSGIIAVSAGYEHTVGLKADGTVVGVGRDSAINDLQNWTDIVSIYAGYDYTVGLKSDGTVMVEGYDGYGVMDARNWTDIVEVKAGNHYIVGLKSDGTVVAAGDSKNDMSGWEDIVAISIDCYSSVVGLKSDGTLVAVGDNMYGECNVGSFKGIKLPDNR